MIISHLTVIDVINTVAIALVMTGYLVLAWLRHKSMFQFTPGWIVFRSVMEAIFMLRFGAAYVVFRYYGIFSLPKDSALLNFLLGDWLLLLTTLGVGVPVAGCIVQHVLYSLKEARKGGG